MIIIINKHIIFFRFDCIFIVRDVRDSERDRNIARHVLGVHINASLAVGQGNNSTANSQEIPANILKKYITYCRERSVSFLIPLLIF